MHMVYKVTGLKKILLLLLMLSLYVGAKTNLLFYCGTTMVKPMLKIAKIIEERYQCHITIIQGGSKDLFESIEIAKKGDLFLPGNSDYIEQKEAYFDYHHIIGYNQLALFVTKGNPLHVKGLDDLVRRDLLVVIGNPDTCSIGKMTEEILLRYKGKAFLEQVKYNISSYAADSRDMNQMFSKEQAEIGLNWIATSRFVENRAVIDTVSLFDLFSPRKNLILVRLKFTKHPEIAKAFIDYVVSADGQKIMRECGFVDE